MTVDGVCLAWGAADLIAGLRDRSVPCRVRMLLWLLAYMAMPIDLLPDVILALGYADDAIAVALVLRSVLRQPGRGLAVRHGLAGLPAAT